MLNLILGDQLFQNWEKSAPTETFLMIESRGMCARYRYHQQRLVLTFSCMRKFADNLRAKGFEVHYVRLDSYRDERSYFELLGEHLKKLGAKEFRVREIADRTFARDLSNWAQKNNVRILRSNDSSELFLTPTPLYTDAFAGKRPFMKTFYEWQRKRLKILVDAKGNPTGGKWSFDTENRKKLPSDYRAPKIPPVTRCAVVRDVIQMVAREFPKNPGSAADFWLPTDTKEAIQWLDRFLKERLNEFGPYEDSIRAEGDPNEDLLNHSALSPMMNVGILPAELVVDRTLKYAQKHKVPLASLEGFIRQVIGWREFIKGIDVVYGERQEAANFFGHKRKLKSCWYDATIGIAPVDAAIRKALRRGYNHHIERLMILSNVMLLCSVDPKDVHRWFMEMYLDSSEWVMGPNVYGMGQFSDGGIFATKPYICGSNYILKMSDYPRDEWTEVWDALYWNFVDRNLEFFRKNPRMGMAANLIAKMPKTKRARYHEIATAFRERTTTL